MHWASAWAHRYEPCPWASKPFRRPQSMAQIQRRLTMHSDVDTLFRALWENYRAVTPSADRIHALLAEREDTAIVNDQIALSTYNLAPVGLDALAAHFLALGYQAGGNHP